MAAGREIQICLADSSTGRISELSEPLLHHVLCFLSQKDAVQTCVLSKSWRYLGSTRPNLVFLYGDYKNQTKFLSILDKTFHRYQDQKLCIHEFHVEFDFPDTKNVSFLEKWFPFIVTAMSSGVKTFDLTFSLPGWTYFDLPSAVFENSKSVRNLRLGGFRFNQKFPMDKVHHLKHLQTLSLEFVHIVDETFQNIMSSCHYIEHVVLMDCEGLTTIRLLNNYHLKRFDFCNIAHQSKEHLCFVNVPNLESMEIESCGPWFNFDRHRNMYFPGLKSLHLSELRLATPRPSLDILSLDFPCLQHFYIDDCSGFGELRVLNHSIKHLTISHLDWDTKVSVDAPFLVLLDFSSSIPPDISFATTSNECVSKIEPFYVKDEDDFLELSKLLKAVSQSKIYLQFARVFSDEDDKDCTGVLALGYDKPAMVEYLHMEYVGHEFFYSEDFLNRMFRYCRPRNILERQCTQRSEFLCKIFLLRQNQGSPYYWQQDLEEAGMEVWDQNSEEWHSVDGTTFLESGADRLPTIDDSSKHHEVWFKLKWRE